MYLPIKTLADNGTILTGALAGRLLFGKLVGHAPGPNEPEPAFLDLTSRLRLPPSCARSVIAFRDYARSTLPNLYPVVANTAESVSEEELTFFLRHRSDAMWACDLNERGLPFNARLIGELDEVQRATFDRVLDLGTASAPTLAAQSGRGDADWPNGLEQPSLQSRGPRAAYRAARRQDQDLHSCTGDCVIGLEYIEAQRGNRMPSGGRGG